MAAPAAGAANFAAGKAKAKAKGKAKTAAPKRRRMTKTQREILSRSNAYKRKRDADIAYTRYATDYTEGSYYRRRGYDRANWAANRKAIRDERARAKRNATLTSIGTAPFRDNGTRANVVGAVTSPGPNPVLLILFMWGALIVVYALVSGKGPDNVSHTSANLLNWVSLIYGKTPMFTTTGVTIPTSGGPVMEPLANPQPKTGNV